jgi:lipopolysaccharide transport system permease protein
MWHDRELMYFFAWRDIKVRYKQTLIGFAWAVIQPLALTVVFTIFFGKFAKIPSNGIPRPVFYFAALTPWSYFTTALNGATNAIVTNRQMITKIYFPRMSLIFSTVLSPLVDLAIALAILFGMMFYYHVPPHLTTLWIIPFTVLTVLTAASVGLWFATLNSIYRDVRYAVPVIIQFWMFASPIAYPTSLVPARFRTLYGLNPMAGVIEGFRWALTGKGVPPGLMTYVSVVTIAVVMIGGVWYFRRTEGKVADVV